MPKSYSQDFREKVMKCVNRGKSCNATSVKFDIAANTVRNWYKRYKSECHYKVKSESWQKRKNR
ncbi:helix-turn-helix domain-containing protein [Orientia tsutsugamushi]|uniref:helix-turn-helix domain-containing protein n=1 Tax=Orientia tsutsugamushi TaxID=784 RepID=UPI000D5A41EA|nr:helix-turn-helix domain-containing protein [Orientia tsutsugamushi]